MSHNIHNDDGIANEENKGKRIIVVGHRRCKPGTGYSEIHSLVSIVRLPEKMVVEIFLSQSNLWQKNNREEENQDFNFLYSTLVFRNPDGKYGATHAWIQSETAKPGKLTERCD